MIGSKVAKRYAKALLSIGKEDGRFQEYGQELSDFSRFCSEQQEFLQVISNQVFPLEERKRILQTILEKSDYSVTMQHFVKLLLDKNRIGAIEQIAGYYENLTDAVSNIAMAEIVTPMPLKEDARERLGKVLEEMTSKQIRIEVKEDASLIGGIVVKIGDLVLDGSIKAQLEGLKESLKRGEYR